MNYELNFKRELPNIKSLGLTNLNFLLKILSSVLPLITDYVYFENSSSNPYLIRRIEELNKVYTLSVLNFNLKNIYFPLTGN